MDSEVWKDIPGYEGTYQVSSLGRVRSLDRVVKGKCHFTGELFDRRIKGRVLRPGKYCKAGHVSVTLGRNTTGRPVHDLVMLAFVGPTPEGKEVCHNNGDPTDNRLCNLRYDTRRENILDVYRKPNGRWRKLSVDDVIKIRKSLVAGEKGADIAKEYGVSQSVISAIKVGRSYGWLDENFISGLGNI